MVSFNSLDRERRGKSLSHLELYFIICRIGEGSFLRPDIYDPPSNTRLTFMGTKKVTRVKAGPKNLVSPSTEYLLVVVGADSTPRQKPRVLGHFCVECSERFSFFACTRTYRQQRRIDVSYMYLRSKKREFDRI